MCCHVLEKEKADFNNSPIIFIFSACDGGILTQLPFPLKTYN
ncbi:hypothetical protein URS_3088 [Acinetobacter ursingii]|nr:hypothetical protein URS_3088 [Acinetobacter ursingii]